MGNDCAQEFGIEDTQITLEESIAGLVDVVSQGPPTTTHFTSRIADLDTNPDRQCHERLHRRKVCILEWKFRDVVRLENPWRCYVTFIRGS